MAPDQKLDEIRKVLEGVMRSSEPEGARRYDKGWDEGRLDLASSLLAIIGRP